MMRRAEEILEIAEILDETADKLVRGVTRELPADWYRGYEGEEIRSTCLCDG